MLKTSISKDDEQKMWSMAREIACCGEYECEWIEMEPKDVTDKKSITHNRMMKKDKEGMRHFSTSWWLILG